jgi:hypothetical protein
VEKRGRLQAWQLANRGNDKYLRKGEFAQMSAEPVIVRTVHGQLEGQMIKVFLESAGIPAVISQESAGQTYGLTIGALGAVDILVPASKASEAQELLDAYDRGELVEGPDAGDEDASLDSDSGTNS